MKKGFTLIELLVVIAIIGILAAIIVANLQGARDRAKNARIQEHVAQLKNEAEIYYNTDGDLSYTGVCAHLRGTELAAEARAEYTDNATEAFNSVIPCLDSTGTSYVLGAKLNGAPLNDIFCVDASGFSGIVLTSGVNAAANLCE